MVADTEWTRIEALEGAEGLISLPEGEYEIRQVGYAVRAGNRVELSWHYEYRRVERGAAQGRRS